MERYQFVRKIGEGSFGWVSQAIDKQTGQLVAIKELRSCDMGAMISEIRALTDLEHPNIVSLVHVHNEDYADFLVFEYMEGSLRDLIAQRRRSGSPFSEDEICLLCCQVLQGLEFIHDDCGYMHRDLKPDNLLVNQGGAVIKISDLGSATEVDYDKVYSHQVGTIWYMAPELLLRAFERDEKLRPFCYDEKVDMWAMGVIMAELFLMCAPFRGDFPTHQLHRICQVLGAPPSWKGPKLQPERGVGLRALIPSASKEAIHLIERLCSWDPLERPCANHALRHPFFKKLLQKPSSGYCTTSNKVPKMTQSSSMLPILGV